MQYLDHILFDSQPDLKDSFVFFLISIVILYPLVVYKWSRKHYMHVLYQLYFFHIKDFIKVNENNFDFPEDLRENVTSLKEIKEIPIQREPLLASILNELDQLINNSDNNCLIEYWIKHCNHINKKVSFNLSNKKMQGIFKGINKIF